MFVSLSRQPRGVTAVGAVHFAFTDSSLDFGERSPELARSTAAVESVAGVPFARADQVHGNHVAVIGVGTDSAEVPTADALVTADPGVGLMIRVADCVPVLLADLEGPVMGAVHAGRGGVLLGVVPAAVSTMRDLGATTIVARIGPHVCGGCYEVPGALREEVAAVVPETRAETTWGTPSLDLAAGVLAQLRAAGVAADEIVRIGMCTRESHELHSHRRDGDRAGRCAALVWRGERADP